MPSISQKELDQLHAQADIFSAMRAEQTHESNLKDAQIASFHDVLIKINRAIEGVPVVAVAIYDQRTSGSAGPPEAFYGESLHQTKRPKFSRAERQEQELRNLHMIIEDLSCRLTAARTAVQFAFEHKA